MATSQRQVSKPSLPGLLVTINSVLKSPFFLVRGRTLGIWGFNFFKQEHMVVRIFRTGLYAL